MRIFFSWQSDIESKYNRGFIKNCLEKAIKRLNQEQTIEEAIRLDHDTKGVKGSPNISETILRKINECDVFIGDISFIARPRGRKYCPNPNVLIELGYAIKALGDERIVNVMNTAFGAPKNKMPFDLAHKRWPIKYALNAKNYSEKAQIRKALSNSFYTALFPYLEARVSSSPEFASNTEKVHHREKLRKEFTKELREMKRKGLRLDAIIRDIDRVDGYPNIDEEDGISSWFKLDLLDTYTNGVQVILSLNSLRKCEAGLRYVDNKKGEESDISAYLIGEIPYDSIVTVNWEGDEYYNFPQIYCYFNHNTEPYKRLFFSEKIDFGNGHFHYEEVSDYKTVKENSKQ